MHKYLALVLGMLAVATSAVQAQAIKWPEKPVRMIVPLSPGGSVDTVARMVAARLTEKFGEQFVVDNRPGAGATVGIGLVARANPDGYTLLMMSSAFASNAALYKLPYDPNKGHYAYRLDRVRPHVSGRASLGEGWHAEGVCRARACKTWFLELRFRWYRLFNAPCDRAVPADDQHAIGARAV